MHACPSRETVCEYQGGPTFHGSATSTSIEIGTVLTSGAGLLSASKRCVTEEALFLQSTNIFKEKIKTFLGTYEGQKDLARGIADLDISEESHSLNKLKYMSQLVSSSHRHRIEHAIEHIHTLAKNRK